MLFPEIRITRIGPIPFMKNKGSDPFNFGNHIFVPEVLPPPAAQSAFPPPQRKMADFTADKAVLVKISFFPYPGMPAFSEDPSASCAAYSHAVAHGRYCRKYPSSSVIARLWRPGRTDIIVVQEFVPHISGCTTKPSCECTSGAKSV